MISVLMSVYKSDRFDYFVEAFNSVWEQQTLKPGEIIVVFDGPVAPEISAFVDEQVKNNIPVNCVKLVNNVGLGAALNLGLTKAKYEFIARMDSDDISVPDRLEKQYNFLLKNSVVDICGGYIDEFDETGAKLYIRKVALTDSEIAEVCSRKNPMNHVTVMFRKSKLAEIGNYETAFLSFEDYGTWFKGRGKLVFANIPEVMVNVRVNSDFASRRSGFAYLKREIAFFYSYYSRNLLSFKWFVINVFVRIIIRLLPAYFLRKFYKIIRGK